MFRSSLLLLIGACTSVTDKATDSVVGLRSPMIRGIVRMRTIRIQVIQRSPIQGLLE